MWKNASVRHTMNMEVAIPHAATTPKLLHSPASFLGTRCRLTVWGYLVYLVSILAGLGEPRIGQTLPTNVQTEAEWIRQVRIHWIGIMLPIVK